MKKYVIALLSITFLTVVFSSVSYAKVDKAATHKSNVETALSSVKSTCNNWNNPGGWAYISSIVWVEDATTGKWGVLMAMPPHNNYANVEYWSLAMVCTKSSFGTISSKTKTYGVDSHLEGLGSFSFGKINPGGYALSRHSGKVNFKNLESDKWHSLKYKTTVEVVWNIPNPDKGTRTDGYGTMSVYYTMAWSTYPYTYIDKTTAQPGDTVTWSHSYDQDGPASTDRDVALGTNHSNGWGKGVSGYSWHNGSEGYKSGGSGNGDHEFYKWGKGTMPTDNDTRHKAYERLIVSQDHVGKNFCSAAYTSVKAWDNLVPYRAMARCVYVPWNWSISAKTTMDKSDNQNVAPGDTITWNYSYKQNGPTKTNKDVALESNNSSINGWGDSQELNKWKSGQWPTSWSTSKSYKVQPDDGGQRLCSEAKATPKSHDDNGTAWGGNRCVNVPWNWKIELQGGVDKSKAKPGDTVTWTFKYRQAGPTITSNNVKISTSGYVNKQYENWQSGKWPTEWITKTESYRVTQNDVGKKLCLKLTADVASQSGNSASTNDYCVNVPYDWGTSLQSKSRVGAKTGDLTGGFTANRKIALPDQRIQWVHDASQDGPTETNSEVNFYVKYRYNFNNYKTTGSVGKWNVGRWPTNSYPYTDKVFNRIQLGATGKNDATYKVTQDDVGYVLCEKLTGSKAGYRNDKFIDYGEAPEACVRAPYMYRGCTEATEKDCADVKKDDNCVMNNTCPSGSKVKEQGLTPIVSADTDVILPGGSLSFTYEVANNKGPTKSNSFNYRAYTFVVDKNSTIDTSGPKVYKNWSETQCWYRGLKRCRSGSIDKTFGSFDSVNAYDKEEVTSDKIYARDYWSVEPGDRICSYLAIDRWSAYGDEYTDYYTPSVVTSSVKCVEVAKHPQAHIRGGDSRADGNFNGSNYGNEQLPTYEDPDALPSGTKILDCKASGAGATGPDARTFCWVDWSSDKGFSFADPRLKSSSGMPVAFKLNGGYILSNMRMEYTNVDATKDVFKLSQNVSARKHMMNEYALSGNIAFPAMHGRGKEMGVRFIFDNVHAVPVNSGTTLNNWEMAFTDSELMSGTPGGTYEETIITSNRYIQKLGYIGNKDERLSYNISNKISNSSKGGVLRLAGGGRSLDANGHLAGYTMDSEGAIVATSTMPSHYEINMMQHRHWGISSVALGFNLPSMKNDLTIYNTYRGSFTQYGLLANGDIRNFGTTGYTTAISSNRRKACRLAYANALASADLCSGENLGKFSGSKRGASTPKSATSSVTLSNGNLATLSSGVYKVDGDINLYGQLKAGVDAVIQISGTAYITGDIRYPNNYSSLSDIPSLVIRASNILIKPNVTNIDGIYISDGPGGRIQTCDDNGIVDRSAGLGNAKLGINGACNRQLTVRGSLIANGNVDLWRTFGSGGAANLNLYDSNSTAAPSEIINLTPNTFLVPYAHSMMTGNVKTFKLKSAVQVPVRY